MSSYDPSDRTDEFDKADIELSKTAAGIGYLPVLFIIPLMSGSPYAKFHANQSLVIFLIGLAFEVLGWVLGKIPLIGSLYGLICGIVGIAYLAFMIIGMLNAFNGTAKELPVVGKITLIS